MGIKRCSVKGCHSVQHRAADMGVTFHQLPAKPEVRAIWVKASRVPDDANVKVCSRHFREADFKLIKAKYFLVKGAYPSIFPWGVYEQESEEKPNDAIAPVSAASTTPADTSGAVVTSSTVPAPVTSTSAAIPEPQPAAKLKRESVAAKRHSIAVETIKQEPVAETKPLRKSVESALPTMKKDSEGASKKVEPIPGKEIEAMDFDNVWHKAKIVEVDSVERELLIHFEDAKLVDEWIQMDSIRLRPLSDDPPPSAIETPPPPVVAPPAAITSVALPEPKYKVGERCLARWSDSRKFKATVQATLPNGLYEVIFDDGFVKTVKLKHMSKLKGARTPTGKSSGPMPQVALVDGEEWYCQWVDDCPVGTLTTAESTVPRTMVRMIQVTDSRLPEGWTKFLQERVHVGSKWDVVIVEPGGRRFRSRQDVKSWIEETANPTLNLADFDFAMHKKRAKEKGVYTYTENYRKFLKALYPSMAEIDTIPATPPEVQAAVMAQLPPTLIEPLPESVVRDWIMVDGMKVQIIDNLLRCPEEGCFKNFRKENLLKIHIKHYHEAMAKKITATPTMTDLAYKRTQSLVVEDVPVVKASNLDGGTSPVKAVKREKPKPSPDTSLDGGGAGGAAAATQTSSAELMKPPSILEQALNSNTTIKTEETSERSIYPKATPITGRGMVDVRKNPVAVANNNNNNATLTAGQKRKYTRRTSEFESPRQQQQQPMKKIKLEQLDPQSSMDESIGGGSVEVQKMLPPQQQYIDENGDVIKIVRMRQEEIINCLCHYPEEDGLMIQCDLCLCWQHGRCNDIEKESQVPDKYVCYICRNPDKGRESMKYVHDQDWLYDGKLPRSTYHTQGTQHDAKRTETLKKIHTLTGNLLELKRSMHSLRVKMNIADNKDHPKLYLWSKRWEESAEGESVSPQKGVTKEEGPNVPKPEAAIDSRQCQKRLMEHIKHVQSQLSGRLDMIEKYVDEIEGESELGPMTPEEDVKFAPKIKQTLHMMMDDLKTMNEIALC